MEKKNKKLVTKKIIDGKQEDSIAVSARTIDELLNEPRSNPFKVEDRKELEAALNDMDISDMQLLASKVEVLPVYNKKSLREKILRQFDAMKNRKPRGNFRIGSVWNSEESRAGEEAVRKILR